MSGRAWLGAVAVLCALRVAIPLAALAASGRALPGLPRYDYESTPGDAQAFYSAAREFIASWQRLGTGLLVVVALALGASAVIAVRAWRVRPAARAWVVVGAAFAASLGATVAITQMSPRTGAAVVGWPLLWGLAMLPYRAVGLPLDPDIAFGFGLALELAASVVTVTATWVIGLRATGRRSAALVAAAFMALWPFLSGLVSGARGWTNGTWNVDAGLHLYDEPISTALVAVAVALLLSKNLSPVGLASTGALLGFATAVRLSNGLFAAFVLLMLVRRLGAGRALPYLAAGLSFAPVVGAWWPKGYAALLDRPDIWPPHPFSADYIVQSWTESLFFSPRAALVLVPLAVLGALALRRSWALALLAGLIAVNAVFYSFYANTAEHPRFLHVALPPLLVLWATGLIAIASAAAKAARGRQPAKMTPS